MNLFPKLDKKEKSWARMDWPGKAWKRARKGMEGYWKTEQRILKSLTFRAFTN